MTDTCHLVHGVFWGAEPDESAATQDPGGGRPAMRLPDPDGGFTELPLDAGTRLGFRLAAAGKNCLGRHVVHGPADRDHVLCPDRAPAVKGSQCERCFVVDDSRLIHDFHRGGRVPPGLRAYLMQPHWLYIATLANGASKVGTAADLRIWKRLAERQRRAAGLDGADLEFVVNLGQLKARTIVLGDHGSGVPAVQESLF